jgi:hypothetical protein
VAVKPVLQALVLADQIYTDGRSGKKVIAGTFNRLWTHKMPARFGQTTWAFICLTEVRGTIQIRLRYRDLRSSEVLLETGEIEVKSDDPLVSAEIIVQVPPFPMPHEGVYAFEVYTGEELLGSLRVSVNNIAEEKQQ